MTSVLLESPRLSLFAESRFAESRRTDPADGRGATLEERLDRALRAVEAEGQTECPVCRSAMHLEGATGRCTGCGSTLA